MNKFSLAITNWNRDEMLMESFAQVLNDERITEIVILDDHSDNEIYESVKSKLEPLKPKVKLFRNPINIGMALAKRKAISLCENDWVIIFDSDNRLNIDYVDSVAKLPLSKNVIYMPEWAMPTFDYRQYRGIIFDRDNIKEFLNRPMFSALLNTCNYVVHKETYLYNYEHNKEVHQTDTIWHLYSHMRRDGQFFVVLGMNYMHRTHSGSGWLSEAAYNTVKGNEILELIRAL